MSSNSNKPQPVSHRRNWLSFYLHSVLVFTLGIACALTPLKLWEYSQPPRPLILLHFKIVEVDSKAEGVFWRGASKVTSGEGKDRSLVTMLGKLVAEKRAKVISEPSMVISDGAPATFEVEEYWPVYATGTGNPGRKFKLDVEGHIQRNGRIALSIEPAVHVKTLDQSDSGPAVRRLATRAEVELQSGQSAIVSGIWQHADNDGDISGKGTFVVVTPEFLAQ